MKRRTRDKAPGVRLAYLVSHPIQYQAPLLRRLAAEPGVDLTVFFCSDVSVKKFVDPEFGEMIEWDVPLLEGYQSEFLPRFKETDGVSFWRPINYGLAKRLKAGRFDALWIHGYARWLHWVAMGMAKRQGVKVILRDEATLISTQRGVAKRVVKRVFFRGLKMLCDGFLAIGTLNCQYYRQQGIPQERIFPTPYAVDNAFFQNQAATATATREDLRRSLGLDSRRPVILYAGKLIARKRPGDLLEAYIRLSPDGRREPHPYLLFIGDGNLRQDLEQRVGKCGWTSIKFLGFHNQSELPRYYNLCDVFVLPSVHEPWGLVVNEVMNAGRAVIVSDRVGCGPDLVKEGENGYLFPAGNVNGLGEVLAKVLHNPQQCRTMGQRSLAIIQNWSFAEDICGLKQALAYVLGRDKIRGEAGSSRGNAGCSSSDGLRNNRETEASLAREKSLLQVGAPPAFCQRGVNSED